MDFKEIKVLAKQKHCPVTDLIVLASANDPFYIGTKTKLKDAEWFADIWERFGYTSGIHLRRIHYQMISQDPPLSLPNGEIYENIMECWRKLSDASKYARYIGLVNPFAFRDRRNPEPIINIGEDEPDPRIEIAAEDWDVEIDPLPEMPHYNLELLRYRGNQRYHVEIWAEKSTMNDILVPICERYRVNLVTAAGEFSITSTAKLISRMREYKKPCRILYISDFDPAGLSMPVAVSRKIEKFLDDSDEPFDVRLIPIILTYEQCQKYELPRTPIKETEKRGASFEKRFGQGATELDALEALHPGELRRIVIHAIRQYRDNNLDEKVSDAKRRLITDYRNIEKEILKGYEGDIEDIEGEYEALQDDIQELCKPLNERIQNVWHGIRKDLDENMPDIEDYPIPDAAVAEELNGQLFNSERTYLEQLKTYKDFQGKVTRAIRREPPKINKAERDLAIEQAIQQIETQFGK